MAKILQTINSIIGYIEGERKGEKKGERGEVVNFKILNCRRGNGKYQHTK